MPKDDQQPSRQHDRLSFLNGKRSMVNNVSLWLTVLVTLASVVWLSATTVEKVRVNEQWREDNRDIPTSVATLKAQIEGVDQRIEEQFDNLNRRMDRFEQTLNRALRDR